MFIITITEQTQGYTYFTITSADHKIDVDFIVYDASTEKETCIWVEVDTVTGAECYITQRLQHWDYDGLDSVQEGINKAVDFLEDFFRKEF
jgi:hypothetical protein